MDALVIALRLEGVSPVMGGLNMVARQIQSLGSQSQAVAQRAQSQSRAIGPYSRQALTRGGQPSYYDAQRDQQLSILKADLAAKRADRMLGGGPSFADRLNTFARSTRFGGGGVMPLAGRTLDLFGNLGKGGPYVMAAIAGVVALGAAAVMASHQLSSISHARWEGGGSLADAVRARGLGAGLGMDAGGVAGLARALQNELATNPYAMGAGSRLGISDVMGNNPIGSKLNRFDNLFKLADAIRNASSDQGAMRLARQFGQPGEALLPLRDLSPDVYKRMMASNAAMFTPDRVQAAADFNAELAMLKNNLMDLAISLTPAIKGFSQFIGGLNDLAQRFSRWAADHPILARVLFGISPGDAKSVATEHTDTLKKNNEALDKLQSTMAKAFFGGGVRARGALPANWSGAYAEQNKMWDGEARKLGAFTV